MYIVIDDKNITPRNFIVCEFYGVETCFCWDADKLIVFPYKATEHGPTSRGRDTVQVLSTPAPVRWVRCFNGRVFVVCAPHGVYKLSRANAFAVLSKNALGIGAEYCEVLIVKGDDVYLDNKQNKSSRLLFPVTRNASMQLHAVTLIREDTEERFLERFTGDRQRADCKNLCVIGYGKMLFALTGHDDNNSVRLIYTGDNTISYIAPVKRENKVAGLLLLLDLDTVVLLHDVDRDHLVFEKIRLNSSLTSTVALCACFSLHAKNVLWIVYCSKSKLYYVRKKLDTDVIQEVKVEEKTFVSLQYYQSNVILGLSEKELIEISLHALDSSASIDNRVDLCTSMFPKTDLMEDICTKVKELDVLYEKLTDERDKLRRVKLYAYEGKLQINPRIEVSRLRNCYFLTINISEKLPKNCYVIFSFVANDQSIFCMKKVAEKEFTIEMPIDSNIILSSATINMDFVTLMNEEAPWCLIRNFINCPLQQVTKKKSLKKNKIAFIDAKIALLRDCIAEKDLNMTKLSEIKKIVRTELAQDK